MSAEVLAVLVPVVLALLGGETFIAYNHPKDFPKVYATVSAVLLAAVVLMMVWNFSDIQAASTLNYDDFKDFDRITKVRNAIEDKEFGFSYFATIMAIWFWNLFLTTLPSWLKKEPSGGKS